MPWYRERWPWLLASGPLVVVVASLCSAWIAVTSDDGLVAEDYYKRGLLINQKLSHNPTRAEAQPGALLTVAQTGEVRVRTIGVPPSTTTIWLKLAHPAHSANDFVVVLRRESSGDYVGFLPEQTPGRWIVTLESDTWQLPITTVPGRLTEVRLGAYAGPL